MKTIPDAIDDVKEAWRKIIDTVYKVIEHNSSKLNTWSWQKRWGNRQRGTGTAMLIKKLIVRLRMWYADVRGHHGKRWNYEPGDWYMGRHRKRK